MHRKAPHFRITAVTVVLIIIGLITVTAVSTVMWQLSKTHEAQRNALVSPDLLSDLSNLISDDGLAKLPELGDKNTDESRIQASLIVAKLAEPRLEDLRKQLSRDRIYQFASAKDKPEETRLLAFETLYYLHDSRAEEGRVLARQAMSSLPATIEPDALPKYLAVAEASHLLDPEVPLRELADFDPGDNEQLQRSATSALGLSHLFSNKEELSSSFFPNLRPKLATWAKGDYQYIQQFLLSNIALNGTPGSSGDDGRRIAYAMQGCASSKIFFSVDGDSENECSLINTHFAWMMGVVI